MYCNLNYNLLGLHPVVSVITNFLGSFNRNRLFLMFIIIILYLLVIINILNVTVAFDGAQKDCSNLNC
jgi:hypothetical protein